MMTADLFLVLKNPAISSRVLILFQLLSLMLQH